MKRVFPPTWFTSIASSHHHRHSSTIACEGCREKGKEERLTDEAKSLTFMFPIISVKWTVNNCSCSSHSTMVLTSSWHVLKRHFSFICSKTTKTEKDEQSWFKNHYHFWLFLQMGWKCLLSSYPFWCKSKSRISIVPIKVKVNVLSSTHSNYSSCFCLHFHSKGN
jgi:hypothetical protein